MRRRRFPKASGFAWPRRGFEPFVAESRGRAYRRDRGAVGTPDSRVARQRSACDMRYVAPLGQFKPLTAEVAGARVLVGSEDPRAGAPGSRVSRLPRSPIRLLDGRPVRASYPPSRLGPAFTPANFRIVRPDSACTTRRPNYRVEWAVSGNGFQRVADRPLVRYNTEAKVA